MLSFRPPPRPKRESFAGVIRGGKLSIRAGCRRVITDEDGNVVNESLIAYAVLDPKPGDRLMLIAFEGEAIGRYCVTRAGVDLEYGDAVEGECVVMRVQR